MSNAELAKRLSTLEAEVARLRDQLSTPVGAPNAQPWWEQIAGAFAGDKAFLEAMRLGREYRESLRPKPKSRMKRKNGHFRHRPR